MHAGLLSVWLPQVCSIQPKPKRPFCKSTILQVANSLMARGAGKKSRDGCVGRFEVSERTPQGHNSDFLELALGIYQKSYNSHVRCAVECTLEVFGSPVQCLGLKGDREPADAEVLLVETISQDCGQQLKAKPCKDSGPEYGRHWVPLWSDRSVTESKTA